MATAMAATDPLREFFGELRSRIVHDFGLERWSAHDRDVALQKLGEIVLQMILIESVDHLTETEQEHVVTRASPQTEESSFDTLRYLMARLQDKWPMVVNRAYEQMVEIALKSREQNTRAAFAEADKLEELVGGGSSVFELIHEARRIESSSTSVTLAVMELLVDPARGIRTPEQRQARFFLKSREILVKALAALWSSALLFTIADTLARRHFIRGIPEIVRTGLPSWVFAKSLSGQWRLFAMLTLGVIAAFLVIGFVAMLLTRSKRVSKLFDVDIADEDYATHYLAPGLRDIFGNDPSAEVLKNSSDLIYRTVYLDGGGQSRDHLAILNEMLSLGDEKRVIVFLKSKVRRYREVLEKSVAAFLKNAHRTLSAIS